MVTDPEADRVATDGDAEGDARDEAETCDADDDGLARDADGAGDADAQRLTGADPVGDGVIDVETDTTVAVPDGERDCVSETVGVSEKRVETVAAFVVVRVDVRSAVLDCETVGETDGEPVTLTETMPDADADADRESVSVGASLIVREIVTAAEPDVADAVPLGERAGERVPTDADPEGDGVTLVDAVGENAAVPERAGVVVGAPDEETVIVPLTVTEKGRVADSHPLTERVAVGDVEAVAQKEIVGEFVTEPEGEPDALAESDGLGESDGEPVGE